MDMDMRMRMGMGMESIGNSIIVDRSCRRTGCDGLMGEGRREMDREMEEHTFIEKEGNEEKVMEEEEGHAAVIFQGSTYLFFFFFFLGFLGGPVQGMYYACMYVCRQQVLSCYVRVIRFGKEKRTD